MNNRYDIIDGLIAWVKAMRKRIAVDSFNVLNVDPYNVNNKMIINRIDLKDKVISLYKEFIDMGYSAFAMAVSRKYIKDNMVNGIFNIRSQYDKYALVFAGACYLTDTQRLWIYPTGIKSGLKIDLVNGCSINGIHFKPIDSLSRDPQFSKSFDYMMDYPILESLARSMEVRVDSKVAVGLSLNEARDQRIHSDLNITLLKIDELDNQESLRITTLTEKFNNLLMGNEL